MQTREKKNNKKIEINEKLTMLTSLIVAMLLMKRLIATIAGPSTIVLQKKIKSVRYQILGLMYSYQHDVIEKDVGFDH